MFMADYLFGSLRDEDYFDKVHRKFIYGWTLLEYDS